MPAAEHTAAIAAAAQAGHAPFDRTRDVLAHASLATLERALREPPAILHLLCHGQTLPDGRAYGLRLDGADPVTPAALSALLAPHRAHLRLVVLAACLGSNPGSLDNALGSVAQAIIDAGIPAVIASRYPLSAAGSTRLTRVLYQRLLVEHESLEQAFLAARAALRAPLPAAPPSLDAVALQLVMDTTPALDFRPWILRPYRGLSPYDRDDAHLFFGRDDERTLLLQRMAESLARSKPRFLVVAGVSGTGKSSLVRAGLLGALEAGRLSAHLAAGSSTGDHAASWASAVMRPGEGAPAENLAGHVAAHRSAAAAGTHLALVVDQLEELFTEITAPGEREAFLRALWGLATDPASGVFVIATVRVEYLGQLAALRMDDSGKTFAQDLLDSERCHHIRQLGPAQYEQIIRGPARAVGVLVEPGLRDRLLHALRTEPGALPLLSYTLDQLWQRRSFASQEVPWSHVTGDEGALAGEVVRVSGWWLTDATYDALGGIEGALASSADALYERLSPAHQAELCRVLVQLVHGHDDPMLATRRRGWRQAMQPEATAIYAEVLDALIDARLLVQGAAGPDAPVWIELAHEALIRFWPRLRQWYQDARSWLVDTGELRAMAAAWQPHARREDTPAARAREEPYLLRGQRLQHHQEAWARHRHHLGVEEQRLGQAFLDACGRGEGQRAIAETRATIDRDASLMTGAREYMQREQPAWATKLLAEVARPAETPEWLPLALEALWHTTLVATLRGHEGALRAAVFSPDRTRVATSSEDGTARVWRADGSGQPLILRGHENQLTALEISPDGTLVLTASLDGTARLWRVDDPAQVTVLRGHGGSVRAATFSPDGTLVLTASVDATARLWRVADPAQVTILRGHGDGVMAAKFSPDGSLVVTASMDGTARLWHVDDPTQVITLRGHDGMVMAAAFSPDGTQVATASVDATARVWLVSDPGTVEVLRHERSVHAVTFSPDSKYVLTCAADTPPVRWAGTSGRLLAGHERAVRSAAFCPVSKYDKRVVTASDDRTARVWELQYVDGEPTILRGHEGEVVSAGFSADGRRVVTASTDKTARIWRVDERDHFFTILRGPRRGVFMAAFTPDGKHLVGVFRGGDVRIWNADDPTQVTEAAVLSGEDDRVYAARLSPDGKLVAIADGEGTTQIWRVHDPARVAVLRGHEAPINSLRFSPDGELLVTASNDNTVRLWRVDSATQVAVLRGHEDWVTSAELSADGALLASASRDSTVRLWRVAQPSEIAVLPGAQYVTINGAQFSPDGKLVITAPVHGGPRVWKVDAPGQPTILGGPSNQPVTSASFSPDGTRAATVHGDATVRLWRVSDLSEVAVLRGDDRDGIHAARFSPDGKLLITSGARVSRLWNLDHPDQVAILRGHADDVTSASFSPDGKRVVTASGDGTIRLWPLDAETLRAHLRAANADCLPARMRHAHLAETEAEATQRYQDCERAHDRVPMPGPKTQGS